MKKKIKELAKQANLNSDVVPYHLSDYDLIEYPAIEKFAELIIQECIKVCQYTGEDVDNGNLFRSRPELLDDYKKDLSTGAYHCIDEIKEYFGI